MLHDERILKNKFAYFFTIIFLLGWIIYYSVFAINILLKGYRLAEKYVKFRSFAYFLNFLVFILLIVTFINIFKESKKMFTYLNVTSCLIVVLGFLSFYMNYGELWKTYINSFLITLFIFLIVPTLLINYFRHTPAKNEIEEIGKKQY